MIVDIVGEHQTCGIKGRFITDNMHTTLSILEYCECMNVAIAMLKIDLHEAFDKVYHEQLYNILEHVNLGKMLQDFW